MSEIKYYANLGTEGNEVFARVTRKTLLSLLREGRITDYLARGDKVDENLNWLTELDGEGWDQKELDAQNQVDVRGARIVAMRVTRG